MSGLVHRPEKATCHQAQICLEQGAGNCDRRYGVCHVVPVVLVVVVAVVVVAGHHSGGGGEGRDGRSHVLNAQQVKMEAGEEGRRLGSRDAVGRDKLPFSSGEWNSQ